MSSYPIYDYDQTAIEEMGGFVYPELIMRNDDPTIDDIYAEKELKTTLENILNSICYKKIYDFLGVSPPKSFLLYGEPGTGKTHTVRCLANTIANKADKDDNLKGNAVAFLEYDIGKYGTKYINEGSTTLQKYFDMGRDLLGARNIHSVIYFFDECDSIMKERGTGHEENDKLLETLMKNLQAINNRDTAEYVFLATNFEKSLDEASIRSGRVDEKIRFTVPTVRARYMAITKQITKINENKYRPIYNYNIPELTRISEGFNYADIKLGIDGALQNKVQQIIREYMTKDGNVSGGYKVCHKDLKEQFEKIRENKKLKDTRRIGF